MPRPSNKMEEKHRRGNTRDIISVILYADGLSQEYTAPVAEMFVGANDKDTCYNVWKFIRDNIRYVPDSPGHEKIKSPAMLWRDRKGDCKSFSIFAASILKNLDIPCYYRFVQYEGERDFTHVYVVAGEKKQYILDAVHHTFDEEVPYIKKKDIMTKVSYLHGPKKTIPPQPFYNWHAMTDGEFAAALLKEKLQLYEATGDPTGELGEAIDLIDRIGSNLHFLRGPVKNYNPRSKVANYVVAGLNRAKRKNYSLGILPFVRGSRIQENVSSEVRKILEQYNTAGRPGPWPANSNTLQRNWPHGYGSEAGKVVFDDQLYDSWEHLFMAHNFDCHYDLATSTSPWSSNSSGRRHRNHIRNICNEVKEYMRSLNEQYEEMAPQYIYEFAEGISGKTYLVVNKRQQHRIAIETISYFSSISRSNMRSWTENGIIRQALQYSDEPVNPVQQIELIKAGAKDNIGAPVILGLTLVQLVGIIATASSIALSFIQDGRAARLEKELRTPSLPANSAAPSDWNKAKATEDALLPIGLLGLGAFLFTN